MTATSSTSAMSAMSATLVAGIAVALDAVLATDLDAHVGEDGDVEARLVAEVAALQCQKARLAALEARLVGLWDARKTWAVDGSRSASSALARDGGLSLQSAKVIVGRARKLATMPVTAKAFAAGELSVDQVDLLTRANQEWRETSFAEHEQMLVGECRRLRYPQAHKVISYWCQHADAVAAEDDAAARDASRYASTATTLDGEVVVHAVLDPVGGSAFCDELERLEHQLYLDDKHTGRKRTIRQRRADALVEMANRSRTAQPGGLRPRPLITVLIGEQAFTRVCETAEGVVVTPGQVVAHLGDADIERIVFDGPSRVIDVSHRRRFTGALRRAIEVRDGHCQHPSGCDIPAKYCDADHITTPHHGGDTSQDNGRLLCPTHNRHPGKRNPKRRGRKPPRPPPRAP